jgi:hypothetical protein
VVFVAGAAVLAAGGVVGYRFVAAKRVAQRMIRVATPVLGQLWDSPEDLPRTLEDSDAIATVSGLANASDGLTLQRISDAGRAGSLRYERVRASRRSRPPEYWALVFDAEIENVAYWALVANPRRARAEPGGPVLLAEGAFSVRVPFEPDGWVAIFRADPTDAAPLESYRRFPGSSGTTGGPSP